MRSILLTLQAFGKRFLVLSLTILLTLSGLFVLVAAPVDASTLEELKLIPPEERLLTPDQKIERAYEYGEAAGLLEEDKQESGNQKLFDPKVKANVKSARNSNDPISDTGLVEKNQNLLEKLTGKK